MLEGHHTRPLYKVIRPSKSLSRRSSAMSQSWYGWAPQQPFYQRAGADKHYAPWKKGNGRGAGALAKGQHKGHGKSEKKEWDQTWPETSKFPKYDQLKAGAQQIIEVHSETASGSAEDGLVRELQRCVNVARKAEQKVTALQKQIQTKQAQWEAFQTELKQSFLKEQQRFTQDLHRLRSELVAAEESQSEARAVVRCAARGEGLLPRQSQLEAEEQWQSKIRAWEQEGQLEEDAPGDAVLRRALEAAVTKPVQQDMRTPLRPTSLGMPSFWHQEGAPNGQDFSYIAWTVPDWERNGICGSSRRCFAVVASIHGRKSFCDLCLCRSVYGHTGCLQCGSHRKVSGEAYTEATLHFSRWWAPNSYQGALQTQDASTWFQPRPFASREIGGQTFSSWQCHSGCERRTLRCSDGCYCFSLLACRSAHLWTKNGQRQWASTTGLHHVRCGGHRYRGGARSRRHLRHGSMVSRLCFRASSHMWLKNKGKLAGSGVSIVLLLCCPTLQGDASKLAVRARYLVFFIAERWLGLISNVPSAGLLFQAYSPFSGPYRRSPLCP